MEMLTFSQQENLPLSLGPESREPGTAEVRKAVLGLASSDVGIREALSGYLQDASMLPEAAATVHAALREAGNEASQEAVEVALEAIAAELQPQEPEPTPEPSAEASDGDSEVMHIVTLLEDLDRLGVQLRCGRREDRLNVTPRSVLEAKHVASIRAWKREIIELLRDYELQETGVLQDERQVFEEFRRVKAAREAG